MLHVVAITIALIVLPIVLQPTSHSDDSKNAIAIDVVQLPPPAPAPTPQPVAEAPKSEPVLQSPKSETLVPPPAPKRVVTAPTPKIIEPPPPHVDPLLSQPSPFNMQIPTVGDSQAQVANLETGHTGPAPSYLDLIRLQLERNKTYPRIAQMRRQESLVVLSFVIDRTGHVLRHAIERSSGYSILDQEAEAILARSDPLPPMPPDMSGSTLLITAPLQFELSDLSQH
jgi:protein TonB